MEFTPDGNTLIFQLFNGEIHEMDEDSPQRYRKVNFDKQIIYIHDIGNELVRSQSDYRTDREKNSHQMMDDVKKLGGSVILSQEQIGKTTKLTWDQLKSSIPHGKSAAIEPGMALEKLIKENQGILNQITSEEQNIENQRRYENSLLVEVHKKYALAVACVVFILVGAPLGIMAKKGGVAVGLGLSLGFFVLYWAFLIGGEELADRQYISAFWAMWSANILIGGAGIYILVKSAKETKFLSWKWTEKFIPKRFRRNMG